MAQAHFINKARKAIYNRGKMVKHEFKKGKHAGTSAMILDRTVPADNKDFILINVGESYWYWQFMHGPKHISKDRPKQSQLTQSEFLSTVYGIEEAMEEATHIERGDIDEWISELENLQDETQNKLDNMPEQLQESSSSGMLLQERIDNLESWISDLEGVDADIDEEDLRNDAQEATTREDEESDEDYKARVEEKFQELLQEKYDEIMNEVTGSNPGF